MTPAPFKTGPLPGRGVKKRPPSHKRTLTGSFGTKVLKLLRCHPNWRFETARSAARRHAPFLGNGGKARRGVMGEKFPVQPALRGPFNGLASAAIPPPAALLKNQGPAYLSASSVCAFELGQSIRPRGGVVKSSRGFRRIRQRNWRRRRKNWTD